MKELLKKGDAEHYVFLAVAALLLIISYLIVKPYLVAIISAFVLAFLAKPVHKYLSKKMSSSLAAGICILILVLVIVAPFILIGGSLATQLYKYTSGTSFKDFLNMLFNLVGLKLDPVVLETLGKQGLNFLISLINPLVSNVVSFVIQLFIMFFGFYFILIKWDHLSSELERYIPFKDRKTISNELSVSTKEIVYGTFLIGLLEFFAAAMGFYALGVDSALLMASLIFLSVFIPAFGPAMVWIPLGLYYAFLGHIWIMIGLFIVGAIISFVIDTVIRNILTGRKSKINPFIMLLGVFGGVAVFGIFGFIIGPLILVYALRFLQEILKDKD